MKLTAKLAIVAAAVFAAPAFAGDITITGPSPSGALTTGTPQPICTGTNSGSDTNFLATTCGVATSSFLYKKDVGGSESGNVGWFNPSAITVNVGGGDDMLLDWTGRTTNACSGYSACWLIVKDGNANPGRYAYNLTTQTTWAGNGDIQLRNFWPAEGSISHVALFGVGTCTSNCFNETPEPGSLALVGLALLGAGYARRRRNAA